MFEELTVFVPAFKKQVVFRDDLVKKLAGVTLVQRAIDKAIELHCRRSRIHVLTDSDEIRLIAERNEVQCHYDPVLVFDNLKGIDTIARYLKDASDASQISLVLSPYSPLIPAQLLLQAIYTLSCAEKNILKPIVKRPVRVPGTQRDGAIAVIFDNDFADIDMISAAFTVFKHDLFESGMQSSANMLLWEIPADYPEIASFHDWWVCEKLIRRKRIVFRVIGNEKVGMGHIYRALSLAHEIVNHEVMFVTDTDNAIAVNQLAGYDYWLATYEPDEVVARIGDLKPDLVVNDILATSADDIVPLKERGIRVVNFEDLGEGAIHADLTINELYDTPQIKGGNILWGHRYFFVRDEFHDAHAHRFRRRVSDLLITFGGTDQLNLSKTILLAVNECCKKRDVRIHIVVGAGYAGYDDLSGIIRTLEAVSLTRSTGVISRIMEKCQVAITSNGRTVYEMAHMNIPAIVISQHEREKTHEFACEGNGFLSLGLYRKGETEKAVVDALTRLLDDEQYRHELFSKTTRFEFSRNKQHVVDLLLSFLDPVVSGKNHAVMKDYPKVDVAAQNVRMK
jgi:spore coat polysaccharide biosynthesis predicted glycosyltransferase SpsG